MFERRDNFDTTQQSIVYMDIVYILPYIVQMPIADKLFEILSHIFILVYDKLIYVVESLEVVSNFNPTDILLYGANQKSAFFLYVCDTV